MGRRKKETKVKALKIKRHLTAEERVTIETMLGNGNSPYQIAKAIGKSPSTITREIKNHTKIILEKSSCAIWYQCKKKRICDHRLCYQYCKTCTSRKCTRFCPDYVSAYCEILEKSSHVCNGCREIDKCGMEKRWYGAIEAQKTYEKTLTEKRNGFDLTEEELKKIDELVSPLIRKGWTPYAIAQEYEDELPCSEATIYRLIANGLLKCRNIDLPEKVKRKPRNTGRRLNKDAYAQIAVNKKGHLWEDYLEFHSKTGIIGVQMDCVEGKKEDNAVVLSLHWPVEHMQLYYIMDNQDAEHVVYYLDLIEQALGLELFQEMFPAIVTDNGKEFTDIKGMERSATEPEEKRTTIFFCEPNRSDQKGHCERNHRLFRRIFPKGTSLEPYFQKDMLIATNNINSYVRKELGGICPYDAAMEVYSEEFFNSLGLERLPKGAVELKPALLRHQNKTA